eukprot:gene8657-34109_t
MRRQLRQGDELDRVAASAAICVCLSYLGFARGPRHYTSMRPEFSSTLQPAVLLPPSELAEPGLDDDHGDDFWDEFDQVAAAAVSTVEPIKAVTALEHLHMHHQSGQSLGAQALHQYAARVAEVHCNTNQVRA